MSYNCAPRETTLPILTEAATLRLSRIIEAAKKGKRVAFLDEQGFAGYGVARSIGDESGCHAGEIDVREQFLRVTMLNGSDRYERVLDLIVDLQSTFFILAAKR